MKHTKYLLALLIAFICTTATNSQAADVKITNHPLDDVINVYYQAAKTSTVDISVEGKLIHEYIENQLKAEKANHEFIKSIRSKLSKIDELAKIKKSKVSKLEAYFQDAATKRMSQILN